MALSGIRADNLNPNPKAIGTLFAGKLALYLHADLLDVSVVSYQYVSYRFQICMALCKLIFPSKLRHWIVSVG